MWKKCSDQPYPIALSMNALQSTHRYGKKPMGPHRPIALMENAPRFIIRKPVFQRGLITPVMRVFSVVTSKESRALRWLHWVDPDAKSQDVQGKKDEKGNPGFDH